MSANLPAKRQETNLAQAMSSPERMDRIRSSLAGMMEPETFLNHCIMAINNPDKPEIRRTTLASQAECVLTLATLGLLPSLNQAALIVYGDKLKVMPQWQGYKAIMMRNPDISDIRHTLVHVNDDFSVGSDGKPDHHYNPLDPKRTISGAQDIMGGYLTITYRNGKVDYHFVTVAYIEECRSCAKAQNVWKKWYAKMAIKTMYRDCYSQRIIAVEPNIATKLEAVNRYDDHLLGNDPTRGDDDPPRSAADRVQARIEAAKQQAADRGQTLDVDDSQIGDDPPLEEGDWNGAGDGDVLPGEFVNQDVAPPDPPAEEKPAAKSEWPELCDGYRLAIEEAETIKSVQEYLKASAKDPGLTPKDREQVQSWVWARIAKLWQNGGAK